MFRQRILAQLVCGTEFLLLIRYWKTPICVVAAVWYFGSLSLAGAWQDKGFNGVPFFWWVIPVRGNASEKGQKMACVHFLIWNVNVLWKVYHQHSWRQESNSFMKCRHNSTKYLWRDWFVNWKRCMRVTGKVQSIFSRTVWHGKPGEKRSTKIVRKCKSYG